MTSVAYGYLDTIDEAYLVGAYLGGEIHDIWGFQVQMVVNSSATKGQQAQMIVDKLVAQGQQVLMVTSYAKHVGQQILMRVDRALAYGQQVQMVLSSSALLSQQVQMIAASSASLGQQVLMTTFFEEAIGQQAQMVIDSSVVLGQQVQMVIDSSVVMGQQVRGDANKLVSSGQQVNMLTANTVSMGMNVIADTLRHNMCELYLNGPYLEGSYLATCMEAFMGMQVSMIITEDIQAISQQVQMISAFEKNISMQTQMIADNTNIIGQQVRMILNETISIGQQVQMIIDAKRLIGQQVKMIVDTTKLLGMQTEMVRVHPTGVQATMLLYNVTQLRIMCEFPSRGTAALLGHNWVASSQYTGEFYPYNVNTDIVEQVYRSAIGTAGLTVLTCDTGIPQGVAIDTIAILNHNMTTSAVVQVQGSNDNFATPPSITFNMLVESKNMYYIAPSFPGATGQNRYWRFLLQDVTNPATYIEVGTILFGSSEIFSIRECFSNPIVAGYKHFKDEIRNEGFTSVSNDRALKKFLRLSFEKLNFMLGNYRILRHCIEFSRTSLKCLIIPTPEYPSRFAIFAKLVNLPEVQHTDIDYLTGYVDLEMEWDESL